MTEELKNLQRKLLNSIGNDYPIGIAHGKMGICIYCYLLSRIEKNTKLQFTADTLLHQIVNNDLSYSHSICVEDGLAGVALGISFLIKNQYIEGDINELLEEIDNSIYKTIAFTEISKNLSTTEILHLVYYLYSRLLQQDKEDDKYIFKELIIKSINLLEAKLDADFFKESYTFSLYHFQLPLLLWILGKLLELKFYNYKIHHIINELKRLILATTPLLHSNRLYLLWGALSIQNYLHDESWEEYISDLKNNISLTKIIDIEIKDKNIFISNGISAIYLFLHSINKEYPKNRIHFENQIIYNRIASSKAWESLNKEAYYFNIHKGLFNGFPGVELVTNFIKNTNYEN